jgi:hypothetical protein
MSEATLSPFRACRCWHAPVVALPSGKRASYRAFSPHNIPPICDRDPLRICIAEHTAGYAIDESSGHALHSSGDFASQKRPRGSGRAKLTPQLPAGKRLGLFPPRHLPEACPLSHLHLSRSLARIAAKKPQHGARSSFGHAPTEPCVLVDPLDHAELAMSTRVRAWIQTELWLLDT